MFYTNLPHLKKTLKTIFKLKPPKTLDEHTQIDYAIKINTK